MMLQSSPSPRPIHLPLSNNVRAPREIPKEASRPSSPRSAGNGSALSARDVPLFLSRTEQNMEGRQSPPQDGADAAVFQGVNKDQTAEISLPSTSTARELGEKMKKIDMKPPQTSLTLSLLAKKTAVLPTGIARVKQLRDAALNQASPASSSGSATGNPRNKTALAPGHSLMDWIRLGSSGVDLTGVGGQLLTVTPAELASHNKKNDAWIAIRGVVFNVSRYMSFHPGGVEELMKGVGKDATKLFDDVHAWVNYQSILQKCIVGRLERSVNAEIFFDSNNDKPKKNVMTENATKPVPEPPSVKMDWRQTTHNITLFFSTPADNPVGECQIKKLDDLEFSLRFCLEKTCDIVTNIVKLTENTVWPLTWSRNNETAEIELTFRKKKRGIWKKYGTISKSYEKMDSSKRTYNEYEVLENIPLCKVVHLLVLRAQNYIQLDPPGRHIEAKMNIMGTEVSRMYTPVPCYLHPEERPRTALEGGDTLCLMIKRYEDGAMTPSLTALQPGQSLALSNTLGDFRIEDFDDFTTMHLLAAGTGLTAMLSVIKRALARRTPPTLNLVNFNTNQDNIFYSQELERVSRERKLTLTHVLSAAESTWSGRTGTVSKELLEDLIGKRSTRACVFTCGPPGFMKVAKESLRNLRWEPSQLHHFDG